MAITITNLTSGTQTATSTTATTATITPAANSLLLLATCGSRSDATPLSYPTVSGLSLVWTANSGSNNSNSPASTFYAFWAPTGASPPAGAITITWPVNTDAAAWILDQAVGADLSGPVQPDGTVSTINGGQTLNLGAMSALRDSRSYYWAAFVNKNKGSWSPEAGASELAEVSHSYADIATTAKNNDTSASATLGGSNSSVYVFGLRYEIAAGAVAKTGKASSPLASKGTRGGTINHVKTGKASAPLVAAGVTPRGPGKFGKASAGMSASATYLERDVGVTPYLEGKVLSWLLMGADLAPPATLYVGLFTTDPDTVAGGTEVSGNGYARARITNVQEAWGPAASGTTQNVQTLGFPVATGAGWGTVTSVGVFDAATSGNLWFWQPVSVGSVTAGKTVVIAAGELTVTLD